MRRSPITFTRRNQVARLGGVILVGGVAAPALLMLGLSRTSASSGSLWLNFEPVATSLWAWVLFHEHLNRKIWLAVLLVFCGGALLASPFSTEFALASTLLLAACFSWGLDNNLTASLDAFTPEQITLVKGLIAGSVNIAIGLTFENASVTLTTLLLALGVGALGYGASLVLYIQGAQALGAARSQLLFAVAPFIGTVLSWLFLNETILATQLAAGFAMVWAMLLIYGENHSHAHSHDALEHTHSHRHDDGHHQHSHPGLPAWIRHTHLHQHEPIEHAHAHAPDLHHRHDH
jgi:drug/metabolite transporter (DMT)-like permease